MTYGTFPLCQIKHDVVICCASAIVLFIIQKVYCYIWRAAGNTRIFSATGIYHTQRQCYPCYNTPTTFCRLASPGTHCQSRPLTRKMLTDHIPIRQNCLHQFCSRHIRPIFVTTIDLQHVLPNIVIQI